MKNEDELSDQEIKSFREKQYFLSDDLEDRVTERLSREGLIHRKSNYSRLLMAAAIAGILILAFATGVFYGRTQTEKQYMFDYVLLLHQTKDFDETATDSQKFQEYSEWMHKIKSSGIAITGEKLSDSSQLVARNLIIGDDNEQSEKTSGLFMLQARSLNEVISIAENSPHVKYGGTIEIRKIVNH